MPLSGTFSTMPFSDLLQWLGDSRRTGNLTVSREFEERFIRFADGAVAGVEGDDPRARDLGRVLVESGFLDEESLRNAVDRVDETGRPLARLRGLLFGDGGMPGLADLLEVDGYVMPDRIAARLGVVLKGMRAARTLTKGHLASLRAAIKELLDDIQKNGF